MSRLSRAEILQKLRGKIAAGVPIIGGGAGTGLSAKAEEAALREQFLSGSTPFLKAAE